MNPNLVYIVGFAPPKVKNAYRGSAYWFIIKNFNQLKVAGSDMRAVDFVPVCKSLKTNFRPGSAQL